MSVLTQESGEAAVPVAQFTELGHELRSHKPAPIVDHDLVVSLPS
jgi:hypothetical protein